MPRNERIFALLAAAMALLGACDGALGPDSEIPSPGNLRVLGRTDSTIMLGWSPVSGARSYELQRSLRATMTGPATIYLGDGTTFTDSGLDAGTPYYYMIRSIDALGAGPFSAVVTGTTLPAPVQFPSIPTGLGLASGGWNALTLSWNRVSGASSYELHRADAAAGPFALVYDGTSSSYEDDGGGEGLDPDTEYSYKVKAKNAAGSSEFSAVFSARTNVAPPPEPMNLRLLEATPTSLELTWDPTPRAEAYEVYRGDSEDGTFDLKVYDGETETCLDEYQIAPDRSYYYAVLAKNVSGSSPLSAVLSARTEAGAPRTPEGLSVSWSTWFSLSLAWGEVSGADAYEVYRSDSEEGPFSRLVYDGPDHSCVDDDELEIDAEYHYKVLAKNSHGPSALSAAVGGRTESGIPDPPTGLALVWAGGHHLGLAWSAAPEATGYEVYRDNSAEGGFGERVYEGDSTSCEVADLDLRSTHYFKVRVLTALGPSGLSTPICGSTTDGLPPAPGGFEVTGASAHSLTLSWEAAIDAVTYVLSRSTAEDGSYTQVYAGTDLLYLDDDEGAGLAGGTTYYYKLYATSPEGDGPAAGPVWYTTGDVEASITIH